MRIRAMVAGAVLALAAAITTGAAPAAAAAPLPVPYGNGYPAQVAATGWNGPVAGANDPACRPSAEHPRPVVLINSTFLSDAVNWTSVAPYLHNKGYCVFTFNYGRTQYHVPPGLVGLDPLPSSAQEVAAQVRAVLAATGASKVDLVGHSQGGVVGRYFIQLLGGDQLVERMVLLSSPFRYPGPVDLSPGLRFLLPRSVLTAIENNGVVPPVGINFGDPHVWGDITAANNGLAPGVDYTEITDRADEVGLLGGMQPPAGASNARTRYINDHCPVDLSMHFAQPYSPTAVAMIANALDPAHPTAPPCTVVPGYRL